MFDRRYLRKYKSDGHEIWTQVSDQQESFVSGPEYPNNKRRAVAAQTARSQPREAAVNVDMHCLGTIDIPAQVVYLSRSQ